MKKSFIAISCLILLNIAPAQSANSIHDQAPPNWQKYLNALPKDAKQTLEKCLVCTSFGGDELGPEESKKFKSFGCENFEKEFTRLRVKYKSNKKVMDAVNCVEKNNSTDCPAEMTR